MSTSTTPPEADTTTTPHTTTETAADATIGELPAAVAAPDVTTPEQLAALKERYIALRLQLDKITDDEIAAREAAIAAGADENELDRQEMIASMESDEHDPWSVLWDQISALKLPDPSEIAFPLIELAADFRREHNTEGARLFRYHLANQDVWQLNNLVERIKVYIIVKTRQSKTTDSAGNASYTMTVESVQNMWILFRHLINSYTPMSPYDKRGATIGFKELASRLKNKYNLKDSVEPQIYLPEPSQLAPWDDYWHRFAERFPNISLRDLVQFGFD